MHILPQFGSSVIENVVIYWLELGLNGLSNQQPAAAAASG